MHQVDSVSIKWEVPMAFFQTVMDSWRMRGLSGEERDALASLLRGLMVADGDFADSELRELGRLGGKAGEAGDAEIRKTTAALMADPEKSPIVYDLLADTVVADELFTRDERDYLDSLKDLGFDPIRFEAALGARARARAHPDLREIGTTRLPNLAAAHAEILRRFSGALDTWRRAAGAVGAWFGRSPSKEAAVALCGNPAADTAALNRLFAHVGAEFVWHGQIVGHLVFEIRITDPAVLDDALRRAPEPSPRREDLVIEPFFTQEDRQRLQRAAAEYGLEWVEYPMLSSDLSSLVAEADFRFFGGQLGRCFKVDIRRVIDQIIAQRNCARVVDALRRMAIEFGKDLHNNLDNLIATVSAGESKRFYIAHDLFWAHLNTLIRRLVG
ncbi:MAG: hypothetical protein NTY46_16630, partial [Candidatus Sumerlaeota bacterium]|nr:hypothetical protein [Candidatus Sumerlaeota bacterium]